MKEISIGDIPGVSIGHAQDEKAKTGVSVIYFANGAQGGCDISGGGPASRETPLTDPLTADNPLNAVVLSEKNPQLSRYMPSRNGSKVCWIL